MVILLFNSECILKFIYESVCKYEVLCYLCVDIKGFIFLEDKEEELNVFLKF